MKNGPTPRRGPFSCSSMAVVGDGRQSADARADHDAGALALVLVLGHPVRIAHRFVGGRHGVDLEAWRVSSHPLGASGLSTAERANGFDHMAHQ